VKELRETIEKKTTKGQTEISERPTGSALVARHHGQIERRHNRAMKRAVAGYAMGARA
jgi:hypothetical protein